VILCLLEKTGLEKEDSGRRRSAAPPASAKLVEKQTFGEEDDAAMDWLMDKD
jgi:hypothetical protein